MPEPWRSTQCNEATTDSVWATLLEQREQGAAERRAATYAGLPFGEPEFVEPLERAVEPPLRRLKPGHKAKACSAAVTAR